MNAIKITEKKIISMLLALLLFTGLFACGRGKEEAKPAPNKDGFLLSFTDAIGNEVNIKSCERVVSLYASFAETWLLSGGELIGVTKEAFSEGRLQSDSTAEIVGTVKQPSLEKIISLNPDFVILSADIEADTALDESLSSCGITHAYYRVDSFDEYQQMLRQFCTLTGREDLYRKNGLEVEKKINEIKAKCEGMCSPSALVLRAYSTGVKVKGNDILCSQILKELGGQNIAELEPSLIKDLSWEAVIRYEPDFIFVVIMGEDEQAAREYLQNTIQLNPAFNQLKAVRQGKYRILPKELFHYKPNARWAESYEYMEKILYEGK